MLCYAFNIILNKPVYVYLCMKDIYLKIMDFLHQQYGRTTDWGCQRVLMSLESGLYYLEESATGDLEMYAGWWLVNKKDINDIADRKLIPEDITSGDTIWVMDAACTNGHGIRRFQRILRQLYPISSGKQGIAWLRNEKHLVSSPRQKGVNDEMVI